MPDSNAAFQFRLTYTGPNDETIAAPTKSVSAPYAPGAQLVGGVDVPDAATSGTEYQIPFGTIASATALYIENRTGQPVDVRLNGAPATVSGTLVSGTKTMALAAVTGEHLSVERVTSAGTAGILSVRRSSGNVIVESWVSGTGIQALDTSDVKVWQGGSPNLFRLEDGGVLTIAQPDVPGSSGIASASVLLTTTQSGAGSVVTKVFGDPTGT